MDVEGAELELLLDLLISGSLQHIDRVMVEYHPYFEVGILNYMSHGLKIIDLLK